MDRIAVGMMLLLLPLGGCMFRPNPNLSSVNESIERAIDFLYEQQLDYGEFRTWVCSDVQMRNCSFGSSPFVTANVLYSLKDVKGAKVTTMSEKAIDFLLNEQEKGGVWRYWSSRNEREIPLDLDDTSVVSFVLRLHNKTTENNTELILNNRNEEGLFFTWLYNKGQISYIAYIVNSNVLLGPFFTWMYSEEKSNYISCIVNTNVLLYLGHDDPQVCAYLNNAIRVNRSCARHYQGELAFLYAVSRAFQNNITCFHESRDDSILFTLRNQRVDGSFGSSLDTALALNTLLNFDYYGQEVVMGVNNLLQTQSDDGSWERGIFCMGTPYHGMYHGSEEITTALAVEALVNFLRFQ